MSQNPPALEFVRKIRLRAADLRPGMYVCELDRPWLETPFMLQGFEVKSEADVLAVMKHCDYVHVDLQFARNAKTPPPERSMRNFILDNYVMASAASTYGQTSDLLKSFLDDITLGQSPDAQTAKSAVSNCISNVIGNPNVAMFLARLRGKGEKFSQKAFTVCVYAIILGRLVGYESRRLENLGVAALLHDIGVAGIPDHILNKPGELTDEEQAIMQTHTLLGRDILMSGRNVFSGAVDVAFGHHENLDGSGYPRSLKSHQISVNTKIVAVVDKYDALVSNTPYRPAKDHLSAVGCLNKLAKEGKLDRDLVNIFVSYLGIYPLGCIVQLSSGEVGIVMEPNVKDKLRPRVLVVRNAEKTPVQRYVDLAYSAVDRKGHPYRITSVCKPGHWDIDVSQYYQQLIQAYN